MGLDPVTLAALASVAVGAGGGVASNVQANKEKRAAKNAATEANKPVDPGALAAPTRRQDTGANVVLGADARDTRASGKRTSGGTSATTGDIFGNLGKAGLSL